MPQDRFPDIVPLDAFSIDKTDLFINTTTDRPEYGPGWAELEFLYDQGILMSNPPRVKTPMFKRYISSMKYDRDVPFFTEERYDSTFGERREKLTYTLGRIRYGYLDGIGYSRKVEVNERIRRHGIATELKKYAEDKLRNEGVRVIYVNAISEEGVELNRSLGYKINKPLTKAYRDTDFPDRKDGVWMRKTI